MDEIFDVLNNAAEILLPILGAIVLLFLAVLLYRAIQLIKTLHGSLNTVDHTLKKVDGYVVQLEDPVKTIVTVSKGIDAVSSTTENIIKSTAKLVMDNFDWIKDFVTDFFKNPNNKGKDLEE